MARKWTAIQLGLFIKCRTLILICMIVYSGILLNSTSGNTKGQFRLNTKVKEFTRLTLVWPKSLAVYQATGISQITTSRESKRQVIMLSS